MDDAELAVPTPVVPAVVVAHRLVLGGEMLSLFESNLSGMTISEIAKIYGKTPSEVVDLMYEFMERTKK